MDVGMGKSSVNVEGEEEGSSYSGIVKYYSNKEIQTKISQRSTYEDIGRAFNIPASLNKNSQQKCISNNAEDAKKTIAKLIQHLKTMNEQIINDIIFNEPTLEYEKVMYVFESIVAEIERYTKKEAEALKQNVQQDVEQCRNISDMHHPQAHTVGGTHMSQQCVSDVSRSLYDENDKVITTNCDGSICPPSYGYQLPLLKRVLERAEDMQYQTKKKLRETLVQALYDQSGQTYDSKFKYSYLQFVGHALTFKEEDLERLLCKACEHGACVASKDGKAYYAIVDAFTSQIVSNGYAVSKVSDYEATTLFNSFNDYGYLALQFDQNFQPNEVISVPKQAARLFTNACNRIMHVISNEDIVILHRLTSEFRSTLMRESPAETLHALLELYMDPTIPQVYGKSLDSSKPLDEQLDVPECFFDGEPVDGIFVLNNTDEVPLPKCLEELSFKMLLVNGPGRFQLRNPGMLRTLSLMSGEVSNLRECTGLSNMYMRYNTMDLAEVCALKQLRRVYLYHVVFRFGLAVGTDVLRAFRNAEGLQYVWIYTADQPEIQQLNIDFRLPRLRFLSFSYYNACPNNQVNIYVNKAACTDLELVDIGNGELKLINGVVPNLVFLDCSNKLQILQ